MDKQVNKLSLKMVDQNLNFNPYLIFPDDLPLIVLSDHTSGVVEFIIKFRTKGYYNHVMFMNRPEAFASQGNTYSEAPLDRYMKRGNRLKFVEVLGLTVVQKKIILASINKKLALPWYKKLYDWLGIVGQASGFKWINVKGLNYCSEDVVLHLQSLVNYLEQGSKIYDAICLLPIHGSPEDLNEYFKKHPDVFRTYGKWDCDDSKN